ncbi:hypothetical protein KI387_033244, partial [Taxus chinensis]
MEFLEMVESSIDEGGDEEESSVGEGVGEVGSSVDRGSHARIYLMEGTGGNR